MTNFLIVICIALISFLIVFQLIVYSEIKVQMDIMVENQECIKEELVLIKLLVSKIQKVTLTGYHPPSKGMNSDKIPGKTALMKKPIPGYTVAISRDLYNMGWLGKKIYIEGHGVFLATDLIGKSVQGIQIDICMGSEKEALKFGKKREISAVIVSG